MKKGKIGALTIILGYVILLALIYLISRFWLGTAKTVTGNALIPIIEKTCLTRAGDTKSDMCGYVYSNDEQSILFIDETGKSYSVAELDYLPDGNIFLQGDNSVVYLSSHHRAESSYPGESLLGEYRLYFVDIHTGNITEIEID